MNWQQRKVNEDPSAWDNRPGVKVCSRLSMLGHVDNKIDRLCPSHRMERLRRPYPLFFSRFGLVVYVFKKVCNGHPNSTERSIASRPNTLMQGIEAPRATRGDALANPVRLPQSSLFYYCPPNVVLILPIIYERRLPHLNSCPPSTTISFWRSPQLNLNSPLNASQHPPHPLNMPAKRVTRASTRAARGEFSGVFVERVRQRLNVHSATAADPPTVPANPPVPALIPAPTNVAQETPAGGPSPRRTRSGKILGMVKSVATKLTRARRAPKAAPIQEAAREVEDNIECVLSYSRYALYPDCKISIVRVVPTTDLATVPQPPAPPRKRGGKAAKKDETEVQIAANDA